MFSEDVNRWHVLVSTAVVKVVAKPHKRFMMIMIQAI